MGYTEKSERIHSFKIHVGARRETWAAKTPSSKNFRKKATAAKREGGEKGKTKRDPDKPI